jgi:hypothetical protein
VLVSGELMTSVTLRNLNISNNDASVGLAVEGADVKVIDSHVDKNNAGGLLALISTVEASGSTFSKNTLPGSVQNPFEAGSGVELLGAAATIDRSTVDGNDFGGVLLFDEGSIGLPGPDGPRAPDAALPATSAVVTHSTVAGNQQGGVVSFGGDVQVLASTVSGNVAGGVVNLGGSADIRNSTITATTLPSGVEDPSGLGGVLNLDALGGAPELRSLASSGRAGLAAELERYLADAKPRTVNAAASRVVAATRTPQAAVGAVTVTGSIVAKQHGVPDCLGTVTDGGYNVSSDSGNSCSFSSSKHDLTRTDPDLGALADNGGPTRTHTLLKHSPAIDAIPAGQAGCAVKATDQRGVDRPQPTGGRCDIGAVELAAQPIVISPDKLPHGSVGTAYRVTLTATGGAYPIYTWALAPGSTLPDGLTLTSKGVLSGTPTKAGSFTFTVSVNDPVLKRYTVVIDAATGTNGGGAAPIANTGAPAQEETALGAGAVLAGFLVLFGAGLVGRRPGRHRVEE